MIGIFPANSVGDDDIEVYADEARADALVRLHHLRQQKSKPQDQAQLCLADFMAPAHSGRADYIGAFAVTAGIGIDEHVARFEAAHDDYSSIMLKALADRLAEAFAERMHERVRREFWGYAADEQLDEHGADPRGISRNPAGAGLSGLPGSHGEGGALETARCRARGGHPPHRVVRHVADRRGQRMVFLASAGALFRRRQDRPRSGDELRAAQGPDPGGGGTLAGAEPGLRHGCGGSGGRGVGPCFWCLAPKRNGWLC